MIKLSLPEFSTIKPVPGCVLLLLRIVLNWYQYLLLFLGCWWDPGLLRGVSSFVCGNFVELENGVSQFTPG